MSAIVGTAVTLADEAKPETARINERACNAAQRRLNLMLQAQKNELRQSTAPGVNSRVNIRDGRTVRKLTAPLLAERVVTGQTPEQTTPRRRRRRTRHRQPREEPPKGSRQGNNTMPTLSLA